MVPNNSIPHVICDRTCSCSNPEYCETCPDRGFEIRALIRTERELKFPDPDFKELRKNPLDKIRQKKNWKAAQEQHSRRR